MIYDFLIIGHGLAGSILAHTLSESGVKIRVIDEPKSNSASNVAAGLMNPLAGKRFAKSWLADELIPFATQFYQDLEANLQVKLLYQKPILKLFSSVEEQNNWMGKSAGKEYNDFIQTVFTTLPASEHIKQEQGGIAIAQGGYVDVPLLLSSLRALREQKQEIETSRFNFTDLEIEEDSIRYKQITAKSIIFSEGYKGAGNPFFSWLPYALNKGELLDIAYNNFPEEYIYNKAVYVLGIGSGTLRVGATYNWREVNENKTPEAKAELLEKFSDLVKKPFQVQDHKVGIRPAVRDRRPLIGTHPRHAAIKVFNGMGSKGVMMAPYLAWHFKEVLAQRGELHKDVNISRYLTLYKEQK